MTVYHARSHDDAAELRRLANHARECATRAMGAGDLPGAAEWLRQAEGGEEMADRVDARAEAAAYRQQAANHRAVGHMAAADECERKAVECDERARLKTREVA